MDTKLLEQKLFAMGYREGLIDGVRRFAYWKDGTQYVGTTGKTYVEAVAEITEQCKDSEYRQAF